jgi:1-acyl-sn-glycerol-3-phosphate acyltransferase
MFRGILTLLAFLVATPVFGLPVVVLGLLRPRSDVFLRCGRPWSRILLAAAGARTSVRGAQHVPPGPCLFGANHQSLLDIPALFLVLPDNARFLAKESLFRIPVLGWAMTASGCIPIDRSNRARAMRSLEQAAARVRAGRSVVFFPEGTRSRDGKLAPFKKGGFHLALQAEVPVVPVAISGSYRILRPASLQVRPGPLRVHLMAPLHPAQHKDAESMAAAARASIASALTPEELLQDSALLPAGSS